MPASQDLAPTSNNAPIRSVSRAPPASTTSRLRATKGGSPTLSMNWIWSQSHPTLLPHLVLFLHLVSPSPCRLVHGEKEQHSAKTIAIVIHSCRSMTRRRRARRLLAALSTTSLGQQFQKKKKKATRADGHSRVENCLSMGLMKSYDIVHNAARTSRSKVSASCTLAPQACLMHVMLKSQRVNITDSRLQTLHVQTLLYGAATRFLTTGRATSLRRRSVHVGGICVRENAVPWKFENCCLLQRMTSSSAGADKAHLARTHCIHRRRIAQ